MRTSVRKHYSEFGKFVRVANLGWDAIFRRDGFPRLEELEPETKHAKLLVRIERSLAKKTPDIRVPSGVPALFLPGWRRYSRASWRRLHAYALVRRLFDSLFFLTGAQAKGAAGATWAPLLFQTIPGKDGQVVRMRDPYEEFLASLTGRDLRRVRSCPVCRRFFLALRYDQKACGARCANGFRVAKFRQKQPEYLRNRQFRKEKELSGPGRGRSRVMAIREALARNLAGNLPEPDFPFNQ